MRKVFENLAVSDSYLQSAKARPKNVGNRGQRVQLGSGITVRQIGMGWDEWGGVGVLSPRSPQAHPIKPKPGLLGTRNCRLKAHQQPIVVNGLVPSGALDY